ncbi:MAG: hypothetical protein ACK40O_14120, partial [Allosphingosinicella sp.]
VFLEIGPAPVLQSYLRESLREDGAEAAILPRLTRRDPAGDPFPAISDRAIARGADAAPDGAAPYLSRLALLLAAELGDAARVEALARAAVEAGRG